MTTEKPGKKTLTLIKHNTETRELDMSALYQLVLYPLLRHVVVN